MTTPDENPGRVAATLAEIRERSAAALEFPLSGFAEDSIRACTQSAMDVPSLLAAVEAALEQADDLMRKSEALDAEAEYIAGEHPEAAAVAVLKRERSIAYDECARWFRAAIGAALTGKEAGDGRH